MNLYEILNLLISAIQIIITIILHLFRRRNKGNE